jgi:hypothetical protein
MSGFHFYNFLFLSFDNERRLFLSEKLYVIHQVEANPTASRVEMVSGLVLALLLSCKIMSNKNKIVEGEIKCGAISKKRMNMTR